jgi:hypothetical protein
MKYVGFLDSRMSIESATRGVNGRAVGPGSSTAVRLFTLAPAVYMFARHTLNGQDVS